VALRSAMVPVPGVSRFGTPAEREAVEEEAVVGSTSETENDLLADVTAGSDLIMGSTWALEADHARQGGVPGPGTGGDIVG
jgi:hypothetical protein